jgi:hypothetical protein
VTSRETDGLPGGGEPWWWLSFADGSLPEGQQFLGGLFLRGYTLPAVITESHLRGLNPGGEVQATELPPDLKIPEKWTERLLSREEITEMDREMAA